VSSMLREQTIVMHAEFGALDHGAVARPIVPHQRSTARKRVHEEMGDTYVRARARERKRPGRPCKGAGRGALLRQRVQGAVADPAQAPAGVGRLALRPLAALALAVTGAVRLALGLAEVGDPDAPALAPRLP
jgi:hypothetical protein